MADKQLVKVTFEYSDGSSKFITEGELDRWLGFNRQVAIFCHIHKNNPDWDQVKWQEVSGLKEEEVIPESFDNVKMATD